MPASISLAFEYNLVSFTFALLDTGNEMFFLWAVFYFISFSSSSFYLLFHRDDATNAVSRFHLLESSIDVGQGLPVGDEFVHLEFTIQIIRHEALHL